MDEGAVRRPGPGRLGLVCWVVALGGMVTAPAVLVLVAMVRAAWLFGEPPSAADLSTASRALNAACVVDAAAVVVTASIGLLLVRRGRRAGAAWLLTALGLVVLPVLLLMAVSPPS